MPERSSTDRAELEALLDRTLIAHVGVNTPTGPLVVPTLHARDGDRLLLHGSTGSGWMRAMAGGAPVCITVSELNALVVARSAFESGVHYASASVFGTATLLAGAEHLAGLDRLTDRLLPGRTGEVRRPAPKELAATMVLAVPIERWSLKATDDWAQDDEQDVAGPAWAGLVPRVTGWGEPIGSPDLRPGIEVPGSVRSLVASDGADGRPRGPR
jgi:nitroimidazol reductase NimA-like FMN-containing flavoprotein (pyridoxamine 5'-phosphate oxidase superfamily)